MTQLNPILVWLQQKIEDYNKDVQRKIDDVANRQKLVTKTSLLNNNYKITYFIWQSNSIAYAKFWRATKNSF